MQIYYKYSNNKNILTKKEMPCGIPISTNKT